MNLNRSFFVFLIFAATMVTAQVKIGENPNYIDAASIIELESTTKTFVLTRVTETQMQSISPLNGAMVYNIETQCIHYFDGVQWNNLCDTSGSGNATAVDNGNGTYTFTNGNSSPITFYGPQETTTTLINNLDGTYTYTNESGAQTTFNAGGPNQNLNTDGTSGTIGIDGGNTISLNVDDADANAGNEIQDLQFSSGIISLTNDPDATVIDLNGFDTDATDDFDGEWTSLANRPAGLDNYFLTPNGDGQNDLLVLEGIEK